MAIVFACPRCRFVMKAPEDRGGSKIKCMQCDVTLEIPYLRGIIVDVPPEQAAPVIFGAAPAKSGSAHGQPIVIAAPKETRVDEWLKEAAERREANDLDGAIKLLRRAFEEIKRANALYPVDTFLRLPLYLQQAAKMKDAWQELSNLLFHGYPNQPRDQSLLAQDRAKVFEKMRQFLEKSDQPAAAAVYGIFANVCKGLALYTENRKPELKSWFSKATCADSVEELNKFPGNLGALQPIKDAIIAELGTSGAIDFDRLHGRIARALERPT